MGNCRINVLPHYIHEKIYFGFYRDHFPLFFLQLLHLPDVRN